MVRLLLREEAFLSFNADIIHVVSEVLFGLDAMISAGLALKLGLLVIRNRAQGWLFDMILKNGRLFLEFPTMHICFTKDEPVKLYYDFHRPSTGKLLSLLKRSHPNQANKTLNSIIIEISKACETCQEFSTNPICFRAQVPPDKIVFNYELAMDLLCLESVPILHVVDIHTNFQSAMF